MRNNQGVRISSGSGGGFENELAGGGGFIWHSRVRFKRNWIRLGSA